MTFAPRSKTPHEPEVPKVAMRWFGPGVPVNNVTEGDMLLIRSGAFVSRIIRFGERLRGHGDAAWCNHAAIVVNSTTLAEAGATGVRLVPIEKYTAARVALVQAQVPRNQLVETSDFAMWSVGIRYGWLSIAAIVLDILTGLHLSFSGSDRMICSAMACRAWERLGLIGDKDPMVTMPSDLARWLNVIPPK